MAVASLDSSEVEHGAYLKDEATKRLYWVAGAEGEAVLLEDALSDELQWWPIPVVLKRLRRVTPQTADADGTRVP